MQVQPHRPDTSPFATPGRAAAFDFTGLWVALATPFREGAIDHAALKALVLRLAADGVAGLVVCGSTGEAAALDEDEQLAVLRSVAEAAPALPRVMGLGGSHQGRALAWARRLADEAVTGLLVPAPSYVRPSQDGFRGWFEAIADAAPLPLLIYDIPYRTGATLERETLLRLAAHPRIVGLKDCGGDFMKTQALIADGRLQVLAGEDAQIFATAAVGGAGAIAASAHLQTRRFVEVVRRLRAGDLEAARALWQPLLPLIDALFDEPNPGPVKAVLAAQGNGMRDGMRDELRAPMRSASAALRERLLRIDAEISRR